MLKRYKCHKEVTAVPMNREAYNNYRGWKLSDDERPDDDGYIVIYNDGYVSWSPKVQFDEGYTEIKDNKECVNLKKEK